MLLKIQHVTTKLVKSENFWEGETGWVVKVTSGIATANGNGPKVKNCAATKINH